MKAISDDFSIPNTTSELISNVGGFKIWECSLDLVAYLNEIVAQGYALPPHVMELGCGHGLPGIYALMNGENV